MVMVMDHDAANYTDAQWRERLSPQQYRILREKGTEPAGSGRFIKPADNGSFVCAGCSAQLFSSDHQFEAHCGWPSFSDVASRDAIKEHTDLSHGMHRIEVTCANCGGHLGHVFNDGPAPTGLRYCINSLAIEHTD